MDIFTFYATGTQWTISTDGAVLRDTDKTHIREYVASFETCFSRFLPHSEVNAFRHASAGSYDISHVFAELLFEADKLRVATDGLYDPAISILLEQAGYNAQYSFSPQHTDSFQITSWNIAGQKLTIYGPVAFDLGSIGKGYCIDSVADILKERGYAHFAVEAGGDMRVSSKKDGSAWKTAIQYPGKPEMAVGVVALKNQALAVSDTFRRRWKNWHHIVDPTQRAPVAHVIGGAAITSTAWSADCMTSLLFLAPKDIYPQQSEKYNASYLVFYTDGTILKSNNWPGTLFS